MVSRFICFGNSPLIQGFEIPIKLVTNMTDNKVNNAKLMTYRTSVELNYKETVNGKFIVDTDQLLNPWCNG